LNRPKKTLPVSGPVKLQVILAEEETAPAKGVPIRWLLLTTLPVETLADAVTCIEYYALRWLIERYHYVLKSGCRIEELQLETAERLHSALATYCIVAWRLLWLTYEARVHPKGSCETFLEEVECKALWSIHHKQRNPPPDAPSLREATRWIAQLGGFLARRDDGAPGVKVVWRGWRRFQDMLIPWRLLHEGETIHSEDVGNA